MKPRIFVAAIVASLGGAGPAASRWAQIDAADAFEIRAGLTWTFHVWRSR